MDLSWSGLEAVARVLLWPIAVWIVASGLDDLFVDIVAAWTTIRGDVHRRRPSRPELLAQFQKPMAILVPLWNESAVIARMIRQNSAAILYRNYHFFIGAYPNDPLTLAEIRRLEARYPNAHLAMCPHGGPTSKADCLNWIFQNVVAYESRNSTRFEIIVIHDAEDVIHSDSLHWINHYSSEYEMVQVPVLPLRTPLTEWVHGVYIDEFTEYQARDMPARYAMGAFVPSQGVGTGFRRDALDALASSYSNQIFEPGCLAEDYLNGLRMRLRGARQFFVPFQREGMATREFFPFCWRRAIRQRTRWVIGIALQTWERHGWGGGLTEKYWLWRDRKGLIGNPASLLTNAVFICGVMQWVCTGSLPEIPMGKAAALLGGYRIVYRMVCVGRVFGAQFVLIAPLRILIANFINTAATLNALQQFFLAKIRGKPLRWVKTEHAYPSQTALVRGTARLGEILVSNGYITQERLDRALGTKPAYVRIGEHLVATRAIDEDCLYEALSLQQALPQSRIQPAEVTKAVARSLPAKVVARHKVVPFKVDLGRLLIAGPEVLTPESRVEISQFTSLDLEFHLVTPTKYKALINELLPA